MVMRLLLLPADRLSVRFTHIINIKMCDRTQQWQRGFLSVRCAVTCGAREGARACAHPSMICDDTTLNAMRVVLCVCVFQGVSFCLVCMLHTRRAACVRSDVSVRGVCSMWRNKYNVSALQSTVV